MGEDTKIEWCTMSWNPWIGCTKVSEGCANCYAATLDRNRYSKTLDGGTKAAPVSHWGPGAPRHLTSEASWKQPLRWNRQARNFLVSWERFKETQGKSDQDLKEEFCAPERPRVFCASLADWLDDEVPIEWLVRLLHLIEDTPQLDWLLLTKRPENWRHRIEKALYHGQWGLVDDEYLWPFLRNWLGTFGEDDGVAPPNIWIGTTVENQARATDRIGNLTLIPARVRFLSCEPLLGPLDLRELDVYGPRDCAGGSLAPLTGEYVLYEPMDGEARLPGKDRIHWVICGGESGPGARPMAVEWARSLRYQCAAAGVPFFMKQMGGVRKPFPPIPEDLDVRQFPVP